MTDFLDSQRVRALAVADTTIYVGGDFSTLGHARAKLAAVSANSGEVTAWNPHANGMTATLVIQDGALFAGGAFTKVDGQERNGLAQFDLATGLLTQWNPDANGTVYSLAHHEGWLYAGGSFTAVGGHPRLNLAAIHPLTGGVAYWNPNLDGALVRASTITVGPQAAYFGGTFLSIDGRPMSYLGATSLAPNDGPTPVLSVNGIAEIIDRAVRVTWSDVPVRSEAIVYRRSESTPWAEVDRIGPGHAGRVTFDDVDVSGPTRLGYRLGILVAGREEFAGETWLDVPKVAAVALSTSNPHRMGTPLRVTFRLADDHPARLELLDALGRIVLSQDVVGHGIGTHQVTLVGSTHLRPQLYFMRLSESAGSQVKRLVVSE